MKFPLSWIKEWVDLEGISPEQIGEKLTLSGIEVDSIEKAPLQFSGVVVGLVKETKPHPEAERLCIATVSDGKDEFQVVCGASNCRAGLVTAYAKVGAKLEAEEKIIKIKKGKLRGVESFGMLCGADELGLGSGDGIIELDAKVGTDLSELYGELIFEVSLTPNLGHCMSMVGIARELSALFERPLTKKPITLDEAGEGPISICIEDEKCTAYGYRKIDNVKVGPSPQWLKDRIEACGVRSVNSIVDVTNYVMLERGQPLHAFDAKFIENDEIRVRSDVSGEFEMLDAQTRKLPEGALMICDSKKPIAVAGIMGGANSEVSDGTTSLVLEAAHFEGTSVRKTSKALGVRTDASARFEKGVDPSGIETALDAASSLIQKMCDAKVSKCVIQRKKTFKPLDIRVRLSRINELLGTTLSLGDVEQIYSALDFSVRSDNEVLFVTVPTFRSDITSEIDLVEEVGRIYGYENIPKRVERIPCSTIPHSPIYLLEKRLHALCVGSGLTEFLTCDLIGPKDLCFVEDHDVLLSVLHPSSVDQSVLRPSLLPSMMQSVKHNFDHQNTSISAFEIGKIHSKLGETLSLGILLCGNQSPHSIDPKTRSVDFFDLKGIVCNLFDGIECIESTHPLLHPGRQATLVLDGMELGVIGQMHPKLFKAPIYFAEINVNEVLKIEEKKACTQLEPLPLYPGSERDWTVKLDENTPIGAIDAMIKTTRSPLLESVYLLDLFRPGDQSKSATFRFSYRHQKKTLPSEAVDREHMRVLDTIEKGLLK